MRWRAMLVVLAMLLVTIVPASAAEGPVRVVLDGRQLQFDVPARLIGGRTMVPLRAIFEALGARVEWDAATSTVTARKGDRVVVAAVGKNEATVDGTVLLLDQPPQVVEGRTLVPARFVAEALGARVTWDGATQTVNIASAQVAGPGPGPDRPAPAPGQSLECTPGYPCPGDQTGPGQPGPRPAPGPQGQDWQVTRTGARYKPVTNPPTSGWFTTGQSADLVLNAPGFEQTGGPLSFNHPGGIASDGTRLILADNWNNRVLIWNRLPDGNVAPDIVLGQQNFQAARTGTGAAEMNWPVGVAAGGGRLVVADTYNDRLLVWNTFPTVSGAPADLILSLKSLPEREGRRFLWPWAVWTDGQRLMATSTAGGGGVLVWNTFPTRSDQAPDMVITAARQMGTPRTIISDGKSLLVGDHNARVGDRIVGAGTYVWKTFPASGDQPYDYFLPDPQEKYLAWMGGSITPAGKLVTLGKTLFVWNSLPTDGDQRPDVAIAGYDWGKGDGQNLVVTGNRVYVSPGYANMILGYRSIPTSSSQMPDFAIGSPDVRTNTLTSSYFIHNPNVYSNGKNLIALSDFDRKLSIWKQLPAESGARPDVVMTAHGEEMAVHGETMATVSGMYAYIWDQLPLDGGEPSRILHSPEFRRLSGVAIDGKHFYLADSEAGKLYVYDGLPAANQQPAFSLDIGRGNARLASDGTYLTVTRNDLAGAVRIFRVADLGPGAQPVTLGKYAFPMYALPSHGHLFLVENWTHRILVWRSTEDALAGKAPDVILGGTDLPQIQADNPGDSGKWTRVTPVAGRNTFFLPRSVSFDGSYLWVGETKFSGRLLRFSIGQ
ncbi:MAG TPA: stalk domain-containing protein [Symbiobacteriaceae bacterium]|nr:stalk domain-containing protein [Symbiobacteriaceae bacterium]